MKRIVMTTWFCRDGITRWYTFEDFEERPCIYFRR